MPKARQSRSVKSKKTARSRQFARPATGAAQDKSVREHLVSLLSSGNAHIDFEKTIADLPADLRGRKPAALPYSPWQLLEHMRIAQWDIVEFSRNPKHVSPDFPSGYWPQTEGPPSPEAWEASLSGLRRDLKRMEKLVSDPKTDLHARIPHGDGQTILREALLLADHNAYHLGQLLILRRLLGAWSG
jgi:hypothetical protein